MDETYELVLGMFGVAIAAVMLVAGELYIVMRPDPPDRYAQPPSAVADRIARCRPLGEVRMNSSGAIKGCECGSSILANTPTFSDRPQVSRSELWIKPHSQDRL